MTDKQFNDPDEIAGSFDFESAICNLFSCDAGGGPADSRDSHRDESMTRMFALQQAYYATNLAEAVPYNKLPPNLPSSTQSTLFHERIHYWQMLACPLQQWQFTLSLDRRRAQTAAAGGEPRWICGQGDRAVPMVELDPFLAGISAHFRPFSLTADLQDLKEGRFPAAFAQTKLLATDWITPSAGHAAFLPTAQILMLLPHSGNLMLPAYGAEMAFRDSTKLIRFPFNGRYLMESAAVLSQALFEGQPLPQPTNLDNPEDELYLGAWEFWRRLHGRRYNSERELAIAFLAAVDLTLVSDVLQVHEKDGEYGSEMSSIPFRFGKLAFRIQGLEPLRVGEDEDPAAAVARFQEQVSAYQSWPHPSHSVKKMAVAITRLLISAVARHIPESQEAREAIEVLYDPHGPVNESLGRTAERFEAMDAVWKLFRYAEGHPPLIGQLVLGAMLNACLYRIRHPGKFALPHIYHTELRRYFPLPLVLLNGSYHTDVEPGDAMEEGWPYPVSAMEMVHDVISLLTTKSLARGHPKQCGFLDEGIDCTYIRQGLGCPLKGLSKAEAELREETKLHDWCHWLMRSLILHTAEPSHYLRWLNQ
jgi:hypothetical protein